MKHVISRSLAVLILILALTVVLPLLSVRLAGAAKALPVGYFICGGDNADVTRLCKVFDEYGFEKCAAADDLRTGVEKGRYSMGIEVPDDFSSRLSSGETEGILTLFASQASALEVLQRTEITSALFEVYAPYITLGSLEESGFDFSKDTVLDHYYDMMDSEQLFSFEQLSVEGRPLESVTARNMFMLVLGLMLWVGMLLGICIPVTGRVRALTPAIGRKKAWRHIGIPAFAAGFVLLFAAALLACSISGYTALIGPSFAVLIAMGVVGMGLCIAFPGGHVCSLVCIFLAALAPALCPSLTDISLIIPIIERIRVICPVYWLWICS